jgi:hypothetical protein
MMDKKFNIATLDVKHNLQAVKSQIGRFFKQQ